MKFFKGQSYEHKLDSERDFSHLIKLRVINKYIYLNYNI